MSVIRNTPKPRSTNPKLGNRSPHLQVHLRCDEGTGNILYDSSGRGNNFVSGEPTGFLADFWLTDGVASFNADSGGSLTDCAILANNNTNSTKVADFRCQIGLQDASGKPPSILVLRRYTPIREQNQFSDGWWWADDQGSSVAKIGWQTARNTGFYANGPKHVGAFQTLDTGGSPTTNTSQPVWETAMDDKFGAGNEMDMGNERFDAFLVDRTAGAAGVSTYHINGSVAFENESLAAAFGEPVDVTTGTGGYCFAIGAKGSRITSSRDMAARLRDFQIYITYKDVPSGIMTAVNNLNPFETLKRSDWS